MEMFYALILSFLTLLVGIRISRGSQEENCDMWAMVKAQREVQAVRVHGCRPGRRTPGRGEH